LALGGLAGQASRKDHCKGVVGAVREAYPDVWLHVLGLSAPSYAREWHRLGVDSFDGASHFKQAFTAGKFYLWDGAELKGYRVREVTPPECDCRVCVMLRTEGVDTRRYGSNESNMGRAAHNLNHLMRAIEGGQADTA
jgi:queuine/archaeosine tRNA-ribosyltransferase